MYKKYIGKSKIESDKFNLNFQYAITKKQYFTNKYDEGLSVARFKVKMKLDSK